MHMGHECAVDMESILNLEGCFQQKAVIMVPMSKLRTRDIRRKRSNRDCVKSVYSLLLA